MALTEEQLLLQMEILATKTDSATNPNMVFKTNATLNKGLNPSYFTGNYTKIVNALNQVAINADNAKVTATNVLNKVNEVMLDVSTTEGSAIWNNVKAKTGKDTVIESIEKIVSGEMQQQVLNLNADDIGKFLMVSENEDGELTTVATGIADFITTIQAGDIVYANPDRPEFPNVQSALDYILNNEGNFGSGGSTAPTSVSWNDIKDKPVIPTSITVTESQLCLNAEEDTLSSVELVTNDDIDSIVNSLH